MQKEGVPIREGTHLKYFLESMLIQGCALSKGGRGAFSRRHGTQCHFGLTLFLENILHKHFSLIIGKEKIL